MERLYDKLKAYSESDFYAFHMPGHKRNKALLGIDSHTIWISRKSMVSMICITQMVF